MKKWLAIPAVILFVLLLPLLVLWGIIHTSRYQRRLRRAAERSKCPGCGSAIGKQSLKLADEQWRDHISYLRRQNPGARFRLARLVHAICYSCGTSLRFVEKTQLFEMTNGMPNPVKDNDEN